MWWMHLEMRRLLLSCCALQLAQLHQAAAQDGCPRIQQQIVYEAAVHEQAVSINTDVQYNTTFFPIPEVAVTVSNAPTSFNGLTTFRWTQTQTSTTSIASTGSSLVPVSTATGSPDGFVLLVLGEMTFQDGRKLHDKRQSGSQYVSANGSITNDCTQTPIYSVNNGVLTAKVNGTLYTYSATSGIAYAMFAPTTIPGPIQTTFYIGANGVLSWQNAAFFNGQASFCAVGNGTVYAVFQQNAQPDGCIYITLTLFTVSSCQAISFATITGPTGWVFKR